MPVHTLAVLARDSFQLSLLLLDLPSELALAPALVHDILALVIATAEAPPH